MFSQAHHWRSAQMAPAEKKKAAVNVPKAKTGAKRKAAAKGKTGTKGAATKKVKLAASAKAGHSLLPLASDPCV
jgi:hypothetical protein